MYKYLHHKIKNSQTLDGQPRCIHLEQQQPQKKGQIYESLPMFVFAADYLQVLYEICQERVKELIAAYDSIQKNKNNYILIDEETIPSSNIESRKTLPKKGKRSMDMRKTQPLLNLKKYTIYEINLVYKVLRTLKKNKNKRI